MKHKTLWDFSLGAVLGALLGMSAVGCLVTAFDLSVSMWGIGICCLFCAVAASFFFVKKLPAVPFLLLGVAVLWLLIDGTLLVSVEGLLYRLSSVYDKGYGWGVLQWSGMVPEALEQAVPAVLYLLGCLVTLLTAWTLTRQATCIPALSLAVVLLGACFVVTDKVPATGWVVVLLFVSAVLLLSAAAARQDAAQGTRLRRAILIPVLLCVLLLSAFVPKRGYDGAARAEQWTDAIVSLWEWITGTAPVEGGINTVDLTQVGRQSYFDSEVLTVTANMEGTLYLRGRALNTYDGKTWTHKETDEQLTWPDESWLENIGEVEITTKYVHRMLYLPYYTTSLDMGSYPVGKENEYKLRTYSVTCAKMWTEADILAVYPDPYRDLHEVAIDTSAYTDLPDSTARWAKQLVEEIAPGMQSDYHIAKAIEAYVKASAAYNLKTDPMPRREQDFARWFLEEGETGYCVHFATAAAVLLRSAGIPARYATGYMVKTEQGKIASVTDADAHAWVEYWLPGYGWTVLEATPAIMVPAVPENTDPATAPTVNDVERDETYAPQREKNRGLLLLVWWLLGAAGAILLLAAQRKARLSLRKRWLNKGNSNEKMLRRWRQLVRCHNALKTPPEQLYLDLAEKAKFSPHTITAEELSVMDAGIDAAVQRLRQKNIFRRFVWFFVFALY